MQILDVIGNWKFSSVKTAKNIVGILFNKGTGQTTDDNKNLCAHLLSRF